MGMFDEVIIERMFCPYCGTAIENDTWQTKDTDCTLKVFPSLDEMFNKYSKIGYFDIIGKCPNCNMRPRITILNTSKVHKELMDEGLKQMRVAWAAEALAEHPNHEAEWRQIWCPKCSKKVADETSSG